MTVRSDTQTARGMAVDASPLWERYPLLLLAGARGFGADGSVMTARRFFWDPLASFCCFWPSAAGGTAGGRPLPSFWPRP